MSSRRPKEVSLIDLRKNKTKSFKIKNGNSKQKKIVALVSFLKKRKDC